MCGTTGRYRQSQFYLWLEIRMQSGINCTTSAIQRAVSMRHDQGCMYGRDREDTAGQCQDSRATVVGGRGGIGVVGRTGNTEARLPGARHRRSLSRQGVRPIMRKKVILQSPLVACSKLSACLNIPSSLRSSPSYSRGYICTPLQRPSGSTCSQATLIIFSLVRTVDQIPASDKYLDNH